MKVFQFGAGMVMLRGGVMNNNVALAISDADRPMPMGVTERVPTDEPIDPNATLLMFPNKQAFLNFKDMVDTLAESEHWDA